MTWKCKQNYTVYENYSFNKKAYVEAKASLKMNEKKFNVYKQKRYAMEKKEKEKVCKCLCVHKICVFKIPGKYIQR